MIVAGGYYREICVSPKHDELFGSGARAAFAIASAGTDVGWHYYCPKSQQQIASVAISSPYLRHHPHTSGEIVSFTYFHPLSEPEYRPSDLPRCENIVVEDANILRFGFMEGDAIVHGDRVVFDPQSPKKPVSFKENGSTAKSLAVVLNAQEVRTLGKDQDELQAVRNVQQSEDASVVLVKSGPHGCRIYVGDTFRGTVPPYRTDRVYKIGSGDIFSAAFAYHWAEKGMAPDLAADAASRCVARYCNSRRPTVLLDDETSTLEPVAIKDEKAKVYIAGPFFTMAELWLVEQACRALDSLGVSFFSPYHEAGLLRDHTDDQAQQKEIERVVEADIKGLSECKAVFAILDGCDPGTIFEIGWAVRHNIPVVALSQNPKPADQTMVRGSRNCSISDDFASAIYRVAWEAWSR
ncbi:PfkB family carbohydrate kinase [Hoeflea poritis]|uniref:PfkB family carbohydrate kinase n=1 Tax=Hoeflea poritis TaxID=2993659 RepID=A0ABT4VV62_9HYPH|nr:PfkB family carbohydrate kinase [Hoeflea poritis]MDA4848613.1 PfkB family carbohydrate kinase [Hoeflea poritis]